MNIENNKIESSSLDDIYFKDVFTETPEGIDMKAHKLTIDCITSPENKFHLDNNGNLSVNSITMVEPITPDIDYQQICNLIYPIGSIYFSINDIQPSTLFGGTWERIKDTFLLSSGDNYVLGTSGGEGEHALSINEMPNHSHILQNSGEHTHGIQGYWRSYSTTTTAKVLAYEKENDTPSSNTPILSSGVHTHIVNPIGENKPHNNMPPYLVVSVFKRIS